MPLMRKKRLSRLQIQLTVAMHQTYPLSPSSTLGFTLLELMSALAIIGLLITISYPLYTQHILKTNRSQAHITLLHVAAELEHFHALHHTYKGANLDNMPISGYANNQTYVLEISDTTENHYKITAIPQQAQLKDTLCGSLSLNEMGNKEVTGSGNVPDCW
jgi:type IV pilus assembly protein PilE